MTEISEEDLSAVAKAMEKDSFGAHHSGISTEAMFRFEARAAIEALISRGWRRREDVLEEAAVHAETVFDNDWQPSWKSAGYSIAEGIRALKDTP